MLFRTTLKYLPAQVLAPLAQLVSMVAWTHWLAPGQMGAFTLVATTQELAYLACISWFSSYALRSLPGADADGSERRRYLQTENVVMLGGAFALGAVALLSALSLPGLSASLWQTVPAIALFFVTRALNSHYAERARAQSHFVAFTLLQSVGPIGGLALGVLALQFVEASATVLWLSYAVAQALGTLLAWPGLGMHWGWTRPDGRVLRQALGFGGPMLGLSALGWIAENHLRYLVQWQSGAAALGLMAVGWGLGRRCASVASMLVSTAAFPIASRLLNEGRRDEAIRQLGLNAALLLAVTLPVCAGLAFIGPAIVQLAVAPAYRDATTAVLGLAVVSGAVRCLHLHVSDQWLVLERRFRLAAWVDIVEVVACAAASLVGLAWFGLRGAVGGQLVGSAIALVVSTLAAGRLGLRWPWRDTLKILVATGAMSLVLWVMGTTATPAGVAQGIAVGAAAYAVAMSACYFPAALARTRRAFSRRSPSASRLERLDAAPEPAIAPSRNRATT